jgi:hypothetical protein
MQNPLPGIPWRGDKAAATTDQFLVLADGALYAVTGVALRDGLEDAGAIQLDDIDATTISLGSVDLPASAAGGSGAYVAIAAATTEATITAANSGKTYVIPDLDADCTFTLPTAAAGLNYTFVYSGINADAHDWVIDTGADANFYIGGLLQVDEVAHDQATATPDGDSNSIINVLTPDGGTRVSLLCDGTNWILSGVVNSVDVCTFADQA